MTLTRKSVLGQFTTVPAIVFSLAAVKLLLHLSTATINGMQRDELYFLACSEHLAWGYVDLPPLGAVFAWLARTLFGTSLLGIHFLPALTGAGLIVLMGLIVHELGGKQWAQLLAGLAILVAGGALVVHSYLSMNALELLIWTGCAYLLIRMIKTQDPRYWVPFGVLAGLGLMNKYTMLMFGLGVVIGLLLSPARKLMANRWFLIGGGIALLIFLPNLIWLIRHDFPMLELLANIRNNRRDVSLSTLEFLRDQALWMLPLTAPLWLGGLAYFFWHRAGRAYSVLGWTYLVVLVALLATQGKSYYLLPAYPMLLAGGAVLIERWLQSAAGRWIGAGYATAMVVAGAISLPAFLLVFPPETQARYASLAPFKMPQTETHWEGKLPMFLADRFGWPEMAQEVAQVYHSLSPEEQAKTAILTKNYGEAGAIDFFGPALGLPKAVSGHLSYFLWGPRQHTGEIIITLGLPYGDLSGYFDEVKQMATVKHPYAIPYETVSIYLCRGLIQPLEDIWPAVKHWD